MYDETYTSARKRRKTGVEPLEDIPTTPEHDDYMLDDDTESSDASSI